MHVLKIGGNELSQSRFLQGLAEAVAQAQEPVVIVHGGGKAIADLQSRLGLETVKVDGLRVTDEESLNAAQMVLTGLANKQIVAALLAAGVDAIGVSGVDGGLLRCQKKAHPTADLGYVGQIVSVRGEMIRQLAAQGYTVVISPISLGHDMHCYNVNADEAASAVAVALDSDLLDFVSNVPGVMQQNQVIPALTPSETDALIESGVIRDGMVPKVRAALEAVALGVSQARIVNLAGLAGTGGTFFSETH